MSEQTSSGSRRPRWLSWAPACLAAFLVGLLTASALLGLLSPWAAHSRQDPSAQRLSASFLRDTKPGQMILAYLACEDFDCGEALDRVVQLGPGALWPLVQLLAHGAPPEIAAELAGDARVVTRTRALRALGALGDARALDAVIAARHDPSPVVRAEAAAALGEIRGDRAFHALLPLLGDPDQLVREFAATALGRLGRRDAVPALRAAAQAEPQPHVRQAIDAAIRRLEQPSPGQP